MNLTGSLRPLYICGSTASGKTSLSIKIANKFQGEIVNLDAYQIYKNLEVLSAAPNSSELTSAPHHLFSILSPTEDHDAQKHRKMAIDVITEIQSRNKLPIVVGGSGMYLKFLTHGPSPVPAGDESLRAKLEERSDSELVQQFSQLDPEGAAQTNLKNRRYVIRALEICLLSNRPMSTLKNEWKKANEESEQHLRGILLQWDRDALRQRIRLRTDQMLEQGVINEIKSIRSLSSTCEKAIGARDIKAHLNGDMDYQTLRDRIFFATCQYAKRQRTWFAKEQWLTNINPADHEEWETLYQKLGLI